MLSSGRRSQKEASHVRMSRHSPILRASTARLDTTFLELQNALSLPFPPTDAILARKARHTGPRLFSRPEGALTVRLYIILGVVALFLALIAGLWLAFGDEISFYVKLFQVNRTGKRFYEQYQHIDRDVAFHPGMAPRLDVYALAEGDGHPVLIFVHGGSWKDYDKNIFAPVAQKLLPEGMVVVIPDYTVHPDATYEQMAREVAAAIAWTLENAAHYGGDPQRVVVAGHSAGAHLIGLAVMDLRYLEALGHSSDDICGWIGLSGVYDIQVEYDYWLEKGTTPQVILEVMGGQQNFEQASPLSYVRAGLPPLLIIHGDEDETVPVGISTAFQAALQAAGASSKLIVYPGAGHSDYLFAALSGDRAPIVDDIVQFAQGCGR
jgi:acetyl esterase/lipase